MFSINSSEITRKPYLVRLKKVGKKKREEETVLSGLGKIDQYAKSFDTLNMSFRVFPSRFYC